MTKKKFIEYLNNGPLKNHFFKATGIYYSRFNNRDYENGAYVMGINTDKEFIIMCWFKLKDVDIYRYDYYLNTDQQDFCIGIREK